MPSTADLSRQQPLSIILLVLWNVAIAAILLFAWPTLAPKAAAPFSWAFGKGFGAQHSMFDLPFMLLWFVPGSAAAVGWILDSFDHTRSAYLTLLMPTVIAATTFTLFGVFSE